MADEPAQKGGKNLPIIDSVLITFFQGIALGVEGLGHAACSQHTYVPRENTIESSGEVLGRNGICQSEMGYLSESVDARIGSSGSNHTDPFSANLM